MRSDLSKVCRPPMRLKHLAEGNGLCKQQHSNSTTSCNKITVSVNIPLWDSVITAPKHHLLSISVFRLDSRILVFGNYRPWLCFFFSLFSAWYLTRQWQFKSSKKDLTDEERKREKNFSWCLLLVLLLGWFLYNCRYSKKPWNRAE